jgi:hypothetical protein
LRFQGANVEAGANPGDFARIDTMADTKHAEMIQDVVGRLAGNSFLAKGWSVTLAAAVIGLAAKDGQPLFLWVGLLPITMFWLVDAYYLATERAFRRLYSLAAARIRDDLPATYEMTPSIEAAAVLAALGRPGTLMVHLPLVAALLVASVVIK